MTLWAARVRARQDPHRGILAAALDRLGITCNAVFDMLAKSDEKACFMGGGGGTYLVPSLFTSGSAKHFRPAAKGVVTNFLPTHRASWPCTHACSPDVQGDLVVRFWKPQFNACASWPFGNVNAARRWW
jgi:hypothetical protein